MQVLILAGGKGTRLKPYTTVIPKPLMPVGDRSILEIILLQLRSAGVTEVILAIAHLSQLFEAFFQEGKRFNLKISYTFEDKPLGTAGAIGLAMDRLAPEFLVMNGDLLTTLDYRRFFESHRKSGAAMTIATFEREVAIDFGVLDVSENGKLVKYTEKPKLQYKVSMGINAFQREAIRPFVKPAVPLDIPQLATQLSAEGKAVHCYSEPCIWLDIGRVEDYQIANDVFEKHRSEFP